MCIHCRNELSDEAQKLDLDLAFPGDEEDMEIVENAGNMSPLSWEDFDFFQDMSDSGPDVTLPSNKFSAPLMTAEIPNRSMLIQKPVFISESTSSEATDDEQSTTDESSSVNSVSILSENPDPIALGFAPRVYGGVPPYLPNPKSFAYYVAKTPEMIREEKLAAMDPFLGALNDGDLFSLFSLCQSQCAPNVIFESGSCGFRYMGNMSIATFWALLFEKHYHGRIQLLSNRINSALTSKLMNRGNSSIIPDSGAFETAEFVIKLEGARMSEFDGFGLFKTMMNSGAVTENLSLPDLIRETQFFYQQHLNHMMSECQAMQVTPSLKRVTYLFEMTLAFHAVTHTITNWKFELLAVDVTR